MLIFTAINELYWATAPHKTALRMKCHSSDLVGEGLASGFRRRLQGGACLHTPPPTHTDCITPVGWHHFVCMCHFHMDLAS